MHVQERRIRSIPGAFGRTGGVASAFLFAFRANGMRYSTIRKRYYDTSNLRNESVSNRQSPIPGVFIDSSNSEPLTSSTSIAIVGRSSGPSTRLHAKTDMSSPRFLDAIAMHRQTCTYLKTRNPPHGSPLHTPCTHIQSRRCCHFLARMPSPSPARKRNSSAQNQSAPCEASTAAFPRKHAAIVATRSTASTVRTQ